MTRQCESNNTKGKPCQVRLREGLRFCHHHGHQAQCIAWTSAGPCESTDTEDGYCPDHQP